MIDESHKAFDRVAERNSALDAAIAIADPGKMPCDCITQMDAGWVCDCRCQNHDDGERSAAWCEGKNICDKIARLKIC